MGKTPFILFFLMSINIFFHSCNENNNNGEISNISSKESCLVCHGDLKGFSEAHNPKFIGCSSCHKGNIHNEDKEIAHKGMIRIPGNLSNVTNTCSTAKCHHNEYERISNSLMTTNSGIVSIDKFAFEEVSHTDTFFHIQNIHKTAAEKHLKNLCYKCHLGYEKQHYGATTELSRGGGCLACHLNYENKPNINDNYHPAINLNIGNDKCFGCHSRSSRISTNYEGWHETVLSKDQIDDSSKYRLLLDGRVFSYINDDVHHKAGLLCIGCHTSQEIMGDGTRYNHENEAVKIQCIDCHIKDSFNKIDKSNIGNIAALDYVLRKYKHQTDSFIITHTDSIPLVNTGFNNDGSAFLIGKIDQRLHQITSISNRCQKDQVHQNLECNMCHTSWAPSCIGCHTSYDKNVKIKGKKERGKWYEEIGEFNSSLPVMGTSVENKTKKIRPAIPGMIMTLDKSKFIGEKHGHDSIFLRLFAPISAHTTTSQPRSCESCHLNPEALGYGKGKLNLIVKDGKSFWRFESLYENYTQDNLPQDAWIGFLSKINTNTKYSAHEGFSPLSLKEQQNILRVGACIGCHKKDNNFINNLNSNYNNLLNKRSEKCLLPF